MKANLIEIFCSLQGEGPYVGVPMVFIRFQDCALSCQFCDTPSSFKKHAQFRVERIPYSGDFEFLPNPLSPRELTDLLSRFPVRFLSLTGGEPLQQVEFLKAWLPEVADSHRLLLETNGVMPSALEEVLPWIDVVSMDMKLPSVTGMRDYWEEHEEFLRVAGLKEVYVKAVVSSPTDISELKRALEIVERVAPDVPFILQPVTPAWKVKEEIPEQHLKQLYEESCKHLHDVRVIPQVHAKIGIL